MSLNISTNGVSFIPSQKLYRYRPHASSLTTLKSYNELSNQSLKMHHNSHAKASINLPPNILLNLLYD